jgi:hypothetical protein
MPLELEAWQPFTVFHRVLFLQFRVYINHLGIVQKLVTEVVHHRGDGVDAPGPFIKTLL